MKNKRVRVKVVDISYELIPSENGYRQKKFKFLAADDHDKVYESIDTIDCSQIYVGRYILVNIDPIGKISNWYPENLIDFADVKQQKPQLASFVNDKSKLVIMRTALEALSNKFSVSYATLIDYASSFITIDKQAPTIYKAYLYFVLSNYIEDEADILTSYSIPEDRLQLYRNRVNAIAELDLNDNEIDDLANSAPESLLNELKPLTLLECCYVSSVIMGNIQCISEDVGHFGMNGPAIQ